MTRGPVTIREARSMQAMRDAGATLEEVAVRTGRHHITVCRHTVAPPRMSKVAARNARLLKACAGIPRDRRIRIGYQYGITNDATLDVILSRTRRALREAGEVATA